MAEFPTGTYRSSTFGTTISNFGNGSGAIRIFNVFLDGGTSTASGLKFFNGVSSSSTASQYLSVGISAGFLFTGSYFDSHAGILFPNGCFITTAGAINFGLVSYRAETI